ncbi:MAG: hypothetical protein H6672_12465 [Anaerolineaceae bacterium]|nr:hypothetical protein [Anaerolineaceae bacterium]
MAFTLPAFTRSVIAQAEWRHQERSTPQLRRWRRWVGQGVLVLTLAVSLILYGGEIAGALLYRDPDPIIDALDALTAFAPTVVLTLHFALMFKTLSLSANSIARERQNQTWEALVLTGVPARTIVLGKWWATVRRMGRMYLLLGLLRACIVGWISASTSRSLSIYIAGNYGGYSEFVPPTLFQFLLVVLVMMAFTLANLGFTAACGVSASAESRQPVMALIRALVTRTIALLAIVFLLEVVVSYFQVVTFNTLEEGDMINTFALAVPGLLDNGLTITATLVVYSAPISMVNTLLSVFLTLALYAGLTWFVLGQAEKQAVKHHALRSPHRFRLSGLIGRQRLNPVSTQPK